MIHPGPCRSGKSFLSAMMFFTDNNTGVGDKVTQSWFPCGRMRNAISTVEEGPGLTGARRTNLRPFGFRTHLSSDDFLREAKTLGCAISSHSADLAPASQILRPQGHDRDHTLHAPYLRRHCQ